VNASPIADSTQRFSNRVTHYVRSRPHYPAGLLPLLHRECGLDPADSIADIGSGTGILTELFLKNGNPVFAVEPNGPMRLAAETAFAKYPNFNSVDATAERTSLKNAAVRFVTAAQAFHWCDRARCKAEFSRILASSGWVILIWNDRLTENNGFAMDYENVVQDFQTDLDRVKHQNLTAANTTVLKEFFAPHTFKEAALDNPQQLDLDGVFGRALSSSYLPAEGTENSQKMLARLRIIFDKHAQQGRVLQPYVCRVFYGRFN